MKNSLNTVLMISENNFPLEDAGAIREEAFALLYQDLGFSVVEICMNRDKKNGTYKNIPFFSLYEKSSNSIHKILNYVTYKFRFKRLVKDIFNKYKNISLIHLYSTHNNCISWLIRFSRKHNIELVHDSVEWYSECEFPNGKRNISYILKNNLNTKQIRLPFKVICISSYLKEFFSNKGMKTIRIPVIMNRNDFSPNLKKDNGKINIIYAGSPANKDNISVVLKSFSTLDNTTRGKFLFHIVGISEQQIINSKICSEKELESLADNILIYGRIKHSDVLKLLKNMDFSILIRPENERYAKAGFPTKSVEAMMSGVAMMCNLSSDLNLYLVDGINAVIVSSDIDSIASGFRTIARMDSSKIKAMKTSAKQLADKCFDYSNYCSDMKKFLGCINEHI